MDLAPKASDVVALMDGYYAGFGEASSYSTTNGSPLSSFSTFTVPSNASSGAAGVIAASTENNVIFAPGAGQAPSYTTNFSSLPTWHTIAISGITWPNPGYTNSRWITADQVNTSGGGTFYLASTGTGQGVWQSTNGGASWTLSLHAREWLL